jgi:GxxExxY protein
MSADLAEQIVNAAAEVHKFLGGPGLVESVYESALCHELNLRSIAYQRQVPVPVIYKGKSIRRPLFLDIFVENLIIVEVKALEVDSPYYLAQLHTHLRFMGIQKGLLINFGKEFLKDGVTCVSNAL